VVHTVKRKFFDDRIHEIASSNKRPWDLAGLEKNPYLPLNPSHTKIAHAPSLICGICYTNLITWQKIDW